MKKDLIEAKIKELQLKIQEIQKTQLQPLLDEKRVLREELRGIVRTEREKKKQAEKAKKKSLEIKVVNSLVEGLAYEETAAKLGTTKQNVGRINNKYGIYNKVSIIHNENEGYFADIFEGGWVIGEQRFVKYKASISLENEINRIETCYCETMEDLQIYINIEVSVAKESLAKQQTE